MSDLPEGFQFSQGSLQDFADCRRRFRLRYLEQLVWPAPVAEPADDYELETAEGELFHRMVHQHQIGLSPTLEEGSGDRLRDWWQNYLDHAPQGLPAARYAEVTLSAPLGAYRLLAQYDLIAIEPRARAVVVDWKTSQKRTPARTLAARMQTRVYRYLLARAGSSLNDLHPIRPDQVEMIYWFAGFPNEPERLSYDAAQYQADEVLLNTLVAEIERAGPDDFPLTDDLRRCRFCSYRSLCNRGTVAGQMDDASDPEEAEPGDVVAPGFDYEQVAEVAF
jgi:CRISPR/Cas system-associated exonuclease Cas4 (RecB family)